MVAKSLRLSKGVGSGTALPQRTGAPTSTNSHIKRGTFKVPQGTLGDPLERAVTQAIKKFGEKLIKEGWRIQSRPQVRLVPVSNQSTFREVRAGDLPILLPTSASFSPDHPWYTPGEDMYEVVFRVSRPPRKATIFLPDDFIHRRGVPKGFRLTE